jgi:DNA glycosylase AlkZ-like
MSPRFTRRPPATISSVLAQDREVEDEVSEIVDALRDDGPMTRRELRQAVESRHWDPGRFGDALWIAQRRGLVRRAGGRLEAAEGD